MLHYFHLVSATPSESPLHHHQHVHHPAVTSAVGYPPLAAAPSLPAPSPVSPASPPVVPKPPAPVVTTPQGGMT